MGRNRIRKRSTSPVILEVLRSDSRHCKRVHECLGPEEILQPIWPGVMSVASAFMRAERVAQNGNGDRHLPIVKSTAERRRWMDCVRPPTGTVPGTGTRTGTQPCAARRRRRPTVQGGRKAQYKGTWYQVSTHQGIPG